jgi:WD40 repeat protein
MSVSTVWSHRKKQLPRVVYKNLKSLKCILSGTSTSTIIYTTMSFFGVIVALAIVAASAYYFLVVKKSPPVVEEKPKPIEKKAAASSEESTKEVKKTNKPAKKAPPKVKRTAHPRFVRRFGGHSDHILDMAISPNGEWLATSGKDGQLRVTHVHQKLKSSQDMHLSSAIRYSVAEEKLGGFKPSLSHIAWSPDNRTLVGTVVHSGEIALFRMRKQKDAPPTAKFPFELVELPKRRFGTASKVQGSLLSCVVDQSHSNYLLVLTESEDPTHGNITVAWDGTNGIAAGKGSLGTVNKKQHDNISNPAIRLSPDGRFACRGGLGGAATQVKLFEIVKKKVKGEVDPVFDKLSSKSVMTLVAGRKVADVCFSNRNSSGNSDLAIVCCVDGLVQVWSLNVDYRQREDTKLLCFFQIQTTEDIVYATASIKANRIAVLTTNSTLHILTYTESSVFLDLTIEETHDELVADVQFCPFEGDVVYTRGEESKDVFSWKVV